MNIKVKEIDLYSAISKVRQLAKFDNNRIYFAPIDEHNLYLYCGSPSVALARLVISGDLEGSLFSFWVALPKLYSFLSVLDGNEYLSISVVKKAIITTSHKPRLSLPIDIDTNNVMQIEDEVGVKLATISPNQFKNLAIVSKVSKDDSGTFSGTLFISDGAYLRALSTDGYGVAYSWQGVKSDFKGTFLIPAIVLEVLTSKTWDEPIAIRVVNDNYVILSSKTLTISAIQMNGKDKFPSDTILKYLDGHTTGSASVEIADLALKLSACATIKYATEKSAPVARIEFHYDNEGFLIETFENQEKMVLDVRTKHLPDSPMEFVLDGNFVNTAIKVFSGFGDVPYVQIGEAKSYPDWVVFQAENTNAIFAFAKIIKDYK